MAQGAGPLSAEPPAPTAALGKGSVAPSPYFWPKPQEKWQLVPGPSRTCCNRGPGWGVVWGQGGPCSEPLGQPDWGLRVQLLAQLLTRSLTLPIGHVICPGLGSRSGWSSG